MLTIHIVSLCIEMLISSPNVTFVKKKGKRNRARWCFSLLFLRRIEMEIGDASEWNLRSTLHESTARNYACGTRIRCKPRRFVWCVENQNWFDNLQCYWDVPGEIDIYQCQPRFSNWCWKEKLKGSSMNFKNLSVCGHFETFLIKIMVERALKADWGWRKVFN